VVEKSSLNSSSSGRNLPTATLQNAEILSET
jgi:hypothetical protein